MRVYPNDDQYFIFGFPIETEIGACHFLTVGEFPEYSISLNVLSHDKNRILSVLGSDEEIKNSPELLKELQGFSLFQLVSNIGVYRAYYKELFEYIFRNESIWDDVTEENFDDIRELIIKMNCVPVEETSSNPEIQRALDMAKENKSNDGQGITLIDMVSSVYVATGTDYQKIADQTYFQLQMTFKRISKFKEYDYTTLLSTVAEKMDITNWGDHIPFVQEESHSITRDKFSKEYGSIMDK